MSVISEWSRHRLKPRDLLARPDYSNLEVVAAKIIIAHSAHAAHTTHASHPAHATHAACGIPGAASGFLGFSATAASVVISIVATLAAFSSAVRTTLVGSITPALTRSSYCSVAALKPKSFFPSVTLFTTTAGS